MIDIPFDQYQRYKNTQLIIESIRKNGEKFKILEVGANSHRNLEKFLPKDNVTYLDISLPEELLDDPQYILGDATDMEFVDNSYDIVVALDVYEHIPQERRENFIKEVYRVCKNNVIISAPFGKKEVIDAESRANCFFKTISGVDHIWLIEHIQNGLPSIERLVEFLDINKINHTHFAHGNLLRWEKLTNMHLSTVVFGKMIEFKEKIDNYYNSFVFQNDYDKMGYRDFFIFNKEREYIYKKELKYDFKDQLNDLEDDFYNLLQMTENKIIEKYEKEELQDDKLKLYVDYGFGFNEEQILTDVIEINKRKTMKFDLGKKAIKAFRIDPTESEGKYIFEDLIIRDENEQKIEEFRIFSNSIYSEGNIAYFSNKDPQYIIEFDKANISTVEFKIEEVKNINTSETIINEVVSKMNRIVIDKENSIERLNQINNQLIQKEHQLNDKIVQLQNELDKKVSEKLKRRIKRVFK